MLLEINTKMIRTSGSKIKGTDPIAVTQVDLSSLAIDDQTKINLPENSLSYLFSLTLKSNLLRNGQSLNFLQSAARLEELDLSYNNLESIPSSLFAVLICLRVIKLEGNLLNDEEHIKSFRVLRNLRNISFQSMDGQDANPVCKKPNYNALVDEYLSKAFLVDGKVRAFRKLSATKRIDEHISLRSGITSMKTKSWLNEGDMISIVEKSFQIDCNANEVDKMDSILNDKVKSIMEKIHTL